MTSEQADLLQKLMDDPGVIIAARIGKNESVIYSADVWTAYIRRRKADGTGFENVPGAVRIDLGVREIISERDLNARTRAQLDRVRDETKGDGHDRDN